MQNDGMDREINEGTPPKVTRQQERYSATKDSFTIGEVVERLRPESRPSRSARSATWTQAFDQPQPHARRLALLVPGYRAPQVHPYARQGVSPAQGHKEAHRRRRRVQPATRRGTSLGSSKRTYTREELADALETEMRFVEELISVGVIGRSGELTQRDAEIARMALEMAKYSIQPRHLRGIMAAVDREAALFKQVLNPDLRSGDDGRVGEAMNKARHLAAVDSRIKELMMANVLDTFSP